MSGGRKDDAGKLPWALLPFDAVRSIVKVLQFGAKKYAPRNWELGMDWDRPFEALMRHLTSWWEREPCDPETGFSHLWHAGCCIVFLIAYEIRGVGKDTRPKPVPKLRAPTEREAVCAYWRPDGCTSSPCACNPVVRELDLPPLRSLGLGLSGVHGS